MAHSNETDGLVLEDRYFEAQEQDLRTSWPVNREQPDSYRRRCTCARSSSSIGLDDNVRAARVHGNRDGLANATAVVDFVPFVVALKFRGASRGQAMAAAAVVARRLQGEGATTISELESAFSPDFGTRVFWNTGSRSFCTCPAYPASERCFHVLALDLHKGRRKLPEP